MKSATLRAILRTDPFDGIEADLVLVWQYNSFSHDLVLRERPRLPAGWNPESVRLEVITELIDCPAPKVQHQWVGPEGREKLADDVVIDFGGLVMIMGHGFPVGGEEEGWALGGIVSSPEATPILKQYHKLPDGRSFLVESVPWTDADAGMRDLPLNLRAETEEAEGSKAEVPSNGRQYAARATVTAELESSARIWPAPRSRAIIPEPVALASVPYEPQGYVVDFTTIPDDASPTTFASGVTYYIPSSYYTGSSITFQAGSVIKYANNATLILYGPVTFPTSGTRPVFTSKNDDQFGDVITGSNGDPTQAQAAKAIWIYYVNFNTVIRNVDIRWAQRGVQYDVNSGVSVNHTIQNSFFGQDNIGVYANLQSGSLVLSSVTKCNLGSAVSCPGYCGTITGSMTDLWNPACSTPSYTPTYWNDDGEIQECNNCYNYATNTRTDTFAQPGYPSGTWCHGSVYCFTVENFTGYCLSDGLIPTTRNAVSPCGMTKLALFLYPEHDFHWFRQDANGYWSHKMGYEPATNLDFSDDLISDPETADLGPFVFAGYWFTCSSSTQGQGQATIDGPLTCD